MWSVDPMTPTCSPHVTICALTKAKVELFTRKNQQTLRYSRVHATAALHANVELFTQGLRTFTRVHSPFRGSTEAAHGLYWDNDDRFKPSTV